MSDSAAPVHLCITYSLREGVSLAKFKRWSMEIDQPAIKALPGIRRYEICEVTDVEEGGDRPDVVEIVETDSEAAWAAVDEHPTMKDISREFFERICEEGSIRTYRIDRVGP
jgi:hypothetical protein